MMSTTYNIVTTWMVIVIASALAILESSQAASTERTQYSDAIVSIIISTSVLP